MEGLEDTILSVLFFVITYMLVADPVQVSTHLAVLWAQVALRGGGGGDAGRLTCVGVTGAMLVTGAGNTAGIGTPQWCLPLVSQSTGLTELARVAPGTRTSLHPGGWRGESPPGRREPDLSQEHWACRSRRERRREFHAHVSPPNLPIHICKGQRVIGPRIQRQSMDHL